MSIFRNDSPHIKSYLTTWDSSICDTQYRRITEVIEDDKERPSIRSSSAERSKKNLNGRRLFSGPRTPAEADHTDEDVTEFKRVQIVAPPNFSRYQPSEDVQDLLLESSAKIPGEFTSGDISGTPKDIELGFAPTSNISPQQVHLPPPPPIPAAAGSAVTPPGTNPYETGTDVSNYDSNRRRRRAERAQAKLARMGGSRVQFS